MVRRGAALFPVPPNVRTARHLAEVLRAETAGGVIMLAAALIAVIWVNSPWSEQYVALRDLRIGPSALHLDLTLATWAADGLLAVFFFVAGLEVKQEFVHGELREPAAAVLPIVAAIAGMVVPALIYLAVSAGTPGATRGWAIPMATDIAFALAVLAVIAPSLPASLRAFLLTLAVVDDLGAIAVIAVFYTETLEVLPLLGAAVLLAAYALAQRYGIGGPAVYVPIGLLVWGLTHESGVHATVAGVALGLLTRTRAAPGATSPAERADHYLRPISAGLAVPVFALLAAGVPVGADALGAVLRDRVALAVIIALLAGKLLGVLGGAWLSVRLGFARLGAGLHWRDIAAVAMLAGIGFTVSLLIGDLAYGGGDRFERVTTAVLIASLAASAIAAVLLRLRVRVRVGHDL